ncbi:MAG: hypothetical protein JXA93_20800, partial [Anaerolineae bacterium]|nr:hypothetical protein [Anaerolineae bacterium]
MRARPIWSTWLPILALALLVRLLTAWLLRQPGYTDAYYYATGARQLALGHGLVEPFVWNYLDPPQDVVHPGFLYWMPLASILGWLGTTMLGNSFRAMQAPFVLISALLPLVAYRLVLDLDLDTSPGAQRARRHYALLAALLAVVPGFYTHVLVLPDSFAPFALAGSICLWAAGRGLQAAEHGPRPGASAWFALAGLAAGFAHLSRADGLLLLAVALLAALLRPSRKPDPGNRLRSLALCLLGYLAVMSPWFVRNWLVSGSPLPGGGLQTLFLTTYDDMFAYGRPLTLDSYLAWGWDEIARSKLLALGQNSVRLWVENFMIVLLPFSALGLWR